MSRGLINPSSIGLILHPFCVVIDRGGLSSVLSSPTRQPLPMVLGLVFSSRLRWPTSLSRCVRISYYSPVAYDTSGPNGKHTNYIPKIAHTILPINVYSTAAVSTPQSDLRCPPSKRNPCISTAPTLWLDNDTTAKRLHFSLTEDRGQRQRQ